MSANGAGAGEDRRLGNEGTRTRGILMPRQRSCDAKYRAGRNPHDLGEGARKLLTGVRRDRAARSDRRARAGLGVPGREYVESKGASTPCRHAESSVDDPLLNQLSDVPRPQPAAGRQRVPEIGDGGLRGAERLAEPQAVQREDEPGLRRRELLRVVQHSDGGAVDKRIDGPSPSPREPKLRTDIRTAAEEERRNTSRRRGCLHTSSQPLTPAAPVDVGHGSLPEETFEPVPQLSQPNLKVPSHPAPRGRAMVVLVHVAILVRDLLELFGRHRGLT